MFGVLWKINPDLSDLLTWHLTDVLYLSTTDLNDLLLIGVWMSLSSFALIIWNEECEESHVVYKKSALEQHEGA